MYKPTVLTKSCEMLSCEHVMFFFVWGGCDGSDVRLGFVEGDENDPFSNHGIQNSPSETPPQLGVFFWVVAVPVANPRNLNLPINIKPR